MTGFTSERFHIKITPNILPGSKSLFAIFLSACDGKMCCALIELEVILMDMQQKGESGKIGLENQ